MIIDWNQIIAITYRIDRDSNFSFSNSFRCFILKDTAWAIAEGNLEFRSVRNATLVHLLSQLRRRLRTPTKALPWSISKSQAFRSRNWTPIFSCSLSRYIDRDLLVHVAKMRQAAALAAGPLYVLCQVIFTSSILEGFIYTIASTYTHTTTSIQPAIQTILELSLSSHGKIHTNEIRKFCLVIQMNSLRTKKKCKNSWVAAPRWELGRFTLGKWTDCFVGVTLRFYCQAMIFIHQWKPLTFLSSVAQILDISLLSSWESSMQESSVFLGNVLWKADRGCYQCHDCRRVCWKGRKTGPEDIDSQVFVRNQVNGRSLGGLQTQLATLHRECLV